MYLIDHLNVIWMYHLNVSIECLMLKNRPVNYLLRKLFKNIHCYLRLEIDLFILLLDDLYYYII